MIIKAQKYFMGVTLVQQYLFLYITYLVHF